MRKETLGDDFTGSTDAMEAQVDEELLRIGRCRPGDIVVITAGSPPGVAGSTNLVRVHHIGEPLA